VLAAVEIILEVLLGPDRLSEQARVGTFVLQRLRIDALQELDGVVINLAPEVEVDGTKDRAQLIIPTPT
jgi:hypothetical protein